MTAARKKIDRMNAVSLRAVPAGRAASAALGFVVAVAFVAVVGSLATGSSTQSYLAMQQPSWAPPPWLFGPVWTVLYLLIAFAGWRFWLAAGPIDRARPELSIYAVGLVLNGLWTPLFFTLGLPVAALVDIVVLDLAIVVTMIAFGRRDRLAGWVLLPYLAWTLFATALNSAIVVLN